MCWLALVFGQPFGFPGNLVPPNCTKIQMQVVDGFIIDS